MVAALIIIKKIVELYHVLCLQKIN